MKDRRVAAAVRCSSERDSQLLKEEEIYRRRFSESSVPTATETVNTEKRCISTLDAEMFCNARRMPRRRRGQMVAADVTAVSAVSQTSRLDATQSNGKSLT